MTRRALITGIEGQDGHYLSALLSGKGCEVFGLDIRPDPDDDHRFAADITDRQSLRRVIEETRPSEIYHLAAQSSVAVSHETKELTERVNAHGLANVVEAIGDAGMDASAVRICNASSSEIFGYQTPSPLTELSPLAPETPYGLAKQVAHEYVGSLREQGQFACNAILFNHESPRRPETFVSQKIATGVARIALGLEQAITLGDTSIRRDWGFAGDYVEAMWLMLQRDKPGDYVIASGESHSISAFLELAFEHAGIADWDARVRSDSRFIRSADATDLYGDPSKAKRELGWEPRVSFKELVAMMVDSAIERLESGGAVEPA